MQRPCRESGAAGVTRPDDDRAAHHGTHHHPHDYEYLGVTESTDARWPGSNGPTVSPICEEMLVDTASATMGDGVTLDAFGVANGPSAWAAGDRRVDRFAVAVAQGFPVRIAGSITGDWEPAGLPGDGFTT